MADDRVIVIASHNPHKFAEVVPLFAESGWRPVLAHDLGVSVAEVDETGATFAENALLKAKAFLRATELPVIADDSGLEVRALQGAPGVHSNRWHPGSYAERNTALLQKLALAEDRSAQFTTVACLLFPNKEPEYFTGIVTGMLGMQPVGDHGFGYDPLFIPNGHSKTFAQLQLKEKQQLSHRSRAFTQVIQALRTRI